MHHDDSTSTDGLLILPNRRGKIHFLLKMLGAVDDNFAGRKIKIIVGYEAFQFQNNIHRRCGWRSRCKLTPVVPIWTEEG